MAIGISTYTKIYIYLVRIVLLFRSTHGNRRSFWCLCWFPYIRTNCWLELKCCILECFYCTLLTTQNNHDMDVHFVIVKQSSCPLQRSLPSDYTIKKISSLYWISYAKITFKGCCFLESFWMRKVSYSTKPVPNPSKSSRMVMVLCMISEYVHST